MAHRIGTYTSTAEKNNTILDMKWTYELKMLVQSIQYIDINIYLISIMIPLVICF